MTGVILMNLGTPDRPDPASVGRYLREFLMDELVIDIPAPLRALLVHGLIVPRRKYASAALYQKIWTERGSPLLVHLEDLVQKVQSQLGASYVVRGAMRYGNPNLQTVTDELRARGIRRWIALPLYPNYSLAATESSFRALRATQGDAELRIIPEFYSKREFMDPLVQSIAKYWNSREYDFLLFSYHGLPERQVRKTETTAGHCLAQKNCCENFETHAPRCYRAQSFWISREVARLLGIPRDRHATAFQSRLGRTPWIQPYSDTFYEEIPKKGVKRLLVACPSFVADCLETLEEVQIRGEEQFRESGGDKLTLVPCLNSDDAWAQGVSALIREASR
jgi:ferrochelatase